MLCSFGISTEAAVVSLNYVLCADARDSVNWTPLHHACFRGHKYVVQYLVEKANCDISEYNTTFMQCYTFVSTPTLVQV